MVVVVRVEEGKEEVEVVDEGKEEEEEEGACQKR